MTVANLLKAPLVSTSGTVDNLTTGTTTSTAQIVTSGTITTLNSTSATITTGTINTGTFGTTTSTAATITTGTIPTLVATTLVTTGTGTAAAPAIVPTGDTNTGIFFPAADTIAFSEGGTEGMRIDSSGKVLIGTTSNDTGGRLEVKQGSSETGIGIQSSGTDDSKLFFRTASGTYGGDILFNGSYVKVSSGTTERMRIDSSGNVGIGTTSPATRLDVSGEVKAKNVTVNVNTLATASGTQDLDFTSEGYLTHAITGNITYTASNYSAGRSLSVRITCDGTQRNLTFPASWVFVGSKPTAIAASKVAVLSITSFGSTEANTVAAYAVQT
jgi:hypothetical protein